MSAFVMEENGAYGQTDQHRGHHFGEIGRATAGNGLSGCVVPEQTNGIAIPRRVDTTSTIDEVMVTTSVKTTPAQESQCLRSNQQKFSRRVICRTTLRQPTIRSHFGSSNFLLDSTQPKKIQDVFWSATKGLIASGVAFDDPFHSNPFVVSGPVMANVSHLLLSSRICCSKLASEVTGFAFSLLDYMVRSSQL